MRKKAINTTIKEQLISAAGNYFWKKDMMQQLLMKL